MNYLVKRLLRNLFFMLFLLLTIGVGIFYIDRQTGFFTRAFGEPANLMVDAGTSYSGVTDVWNREYMNN